MAISCNLTEPSTPGTSSESTGVSVSETSGANETTIADLDIDSLAHCTSYLSLLDISNMAMSCKFLQRVAYSDLVWNRLYREKWPHLLPHCATSGVRVAYLDRISALQQFKFVDPLIADFYTVARPYQYILLDKNSMVLSQGSLIQVMKIDKFLNGRDFVVSLNDHKARVTCMRIFPLNETSLFRAETQSSENVLVSSSCDHSIRLWWKGTCHRCFRGHNGPVLSLSDKLLGDVSAKLLASGGEDGTVRLWSLGSGSKRGQQALKATFYGHEKPIKLVSVTEYKNSLLVSISTDSKIRVWDANASSAIRSSCCVGMTSVAGTPVNMKCHESLLYIASGSHVIAIDLRTMQKVSTLATSKSRICSFDIMPSKSSFCTGEDDKALLWDIRKNQARMKTDPITELDRHVGPVIHLHMDSYKIVTGTQEDVNVNIWEAGTGFFSNSLSCCSPEEVGPCFGCSALAVDKYRIITAAYGKECGLLRLWDFKNAICPVSLYEDEHSSKFWGPQSSYSDDDDD
ncbi:hypothetical protein SAY87_018587 [Trapa incisa]|uniref:Uncharacterized protein n=1 Tax=Trapa incisa TaxID=236973 RepID=A0AAN7QWA8_9MYRT|nr:hypothetical protein SAY87_018587 [Trapa incisa]